MNPPGSNLSDSDLQAQRDLLRRRLQRANLVAAVIFFIVASLAAVAMVAAWRAERDSAAARNASHQTEQQRALAEEQLWKSRLATARAVRRSGQPGRRFDALENIRAAARSRPSLELRNEAIASLALVDLGPDQNFWPYPEGVSGEALSPDFERLARAFTDGTVRLYRARDNQELFSLPPAGERARFLRFSPDGRYLAVAHRRQARVWDLDRREVVAKSEFQESPAVDVPIVFSADSRRVALGKNGGPVTIHDLPGGAVWRQVPAAKGLQSITFHPTEPRLAASMAAGVVVFDLGPLTTNAVFRTPSGQWPNKIDWSPDGRWIAGGCEDARIHLWDTQLGRHRVLTEHKREVVNVAFNHRGDQLLSQSWAANTRIWDVASGATLVSTFRGYGGGFSADDQRVSFYRPGQGAGVWPLSENRVVRQLNAPESAASDIRTLEFSPDGRLILSVGYRRGLHLWDARRHRLLWSTNLAEPGSVFFAPDGKWAVTAGRGGVWRWPIEQSGGSDGMEARLGIPEKIPLPPGVSGTAGRLSPDGAKLLLIASQFHGWLLDLKNPSVEPVRVGDQPGFGSVCFSPDGRWIAGGTWKGVGTWLFDAKTGQPAHKFGGRDARVLFDATGHRLVVGTAVDYQFWDVATRQIATRLPREATGESLGLMTFDAAGRWLALAPSLQAVHLLDAASLEVIAAFEVPGEDTVLGLRLSPDGQTLAVIAGQVAHLWDLRQVRHELAALGLDWDQPLPASPAIAATALAATAATPVKGALASRGVISLALAGLAGAVLVSIFVLTRLRRLMSDYGRIETVAAQRSRELQTAQREVIHSQKMKALGTLAAGIAHDFNNLLSVIRMSNQLTGESAKGNTDIAENVAEVEQAVQQGKKVVRSMLGYSRDDENETGPFALPELVEDTVALLSKQFLSGIALTLELDRDVSLARGSRSRLEQVLLNLIVNATEAMGGSGSLRISVRGATAQPERLVLRARESPSYVELDVADSGPGIAPDILPRIFEPFFTTKHRGVVRGTGLGLSTVYSIAEQDGLGLAVETEAGRGTRFRVFIPVPNEIRA
jgi:signal transduction histidine kinase